MAKETVVIRAGPGARLVEEAIAIVNVGRMVGAKLACRQIRSQSNVSPLAFCHQDF